jgi:hypothetical protein
MLHMATGTPIDPAALSLVSRHLSLSSAGSSLGATGLFPVNHKMVLCDDNFATIGGAAASARRRCERGATRMGEHTILSSLVWVQLYDRVSPDNQRSTILKLCHEGDLTGVIQALATDECVRDDGAAERVAHLDHAIR